MKYCVQGIGFSLSAPITKSNIETDFVSEPKNGFFMFTLHNTAHLYGSIFFNPLWL